MARLPKIANQRYSAPQITVQPPPANLGEIQFRHLNNQKSDASIAMFNSECEKLKYFIALGNEPHAPKGTISGLNRRHNLFYKYKENKENDPNQWPRSYIYASKCLDMWPVDNLCTLDVTTVIYDTHDDRGKFLLCSMYWSKDYGCLLYTSPSPRDLSTSRMPSSA